MYMDEGIDFIDEYLEIFDFFQRKIIIFMIILKYN